ncbi:MAG: nitroreductase family protein [Nitrospinota bacterium]
MKELDQDLVKLMPPKRRGGPGLYTCLKRRRSFRHFLSKPISFEDLSQLLWCADGVSDDESKYRTAPSPFAAFPMEVHAITNEGFYRYNPIDHSLERRFKGQLIREIGKQRAAISFTAAAPLVVMISSVIDRFRRFRLPPGHGGPFLPKEWHAHASVSLILEAAHICQNLLLAAAGLGMCGVAVCNFNRTKIRRILRVDQEPFTISDIHYLVPIAYPNMKSAKVLDKDWAHVQKMSIPEYPDYFFKEGEEPHI